MTQRTTHARVSSTDLLVAMLSGDLRSSWDGEGFSIRHREHVDPAASSPLPVMTEPGDPEDPEGLNRH
jgi:hypothetical protein